MAVVAVGRVESRSLVKVFEGPGALAEIEKCYSCRTVRFHGQGGIPHVRRQLQELFCDLQSGSQFAAEDVRQAERPQQTK